MKKLEGYKIDFDTKLGFGACGAVYKGKQDKTNKECAIKVIDKHLTQSNEYLDRAIHTQILILQKVKSNNIVEIYDFMESRKNYYIAQQLCESDMSKFMKKNSNIPEANAIKLLKQIVNGFLTLVKQGIIHRDLKPQNILLSHGQVKIADFGFSKMNTTQTGQNTSYVGTPLYMALQNLKGQPYTSKCDVWALGCIFYQLLHNKTPWTAESIFSLIQKIQHQPLIINQNLSLGIKDFLKKSLAILQEDRMSWDEVFSHPIFQKYFQQFRSNINKQIQDKLKGIMNSLRFRINSLNIDVKGLFQQLGFYNQLNFSQFKQFIKSFNANVSDEEIRYFFQRVDEDSSNTISVKQITNIMDKYQILNQPNPQKKTFIPQEQIGKIEKNFQAENKVKEMFLTWHKILQYRNILLKQVFQAYYKNTESISSSELKNMMSQMMPKRTIVQGDLLSVFRKMQNSQSEKIKLKDIYDYYCKVNNIPNQ